MTTIVFIIAVLWCPAALLFVLGLGAAARRPVPEMELPKETLDPALPSLKELDKQFAVR